MPDEVYLISKVTVDVVYGGRMRTATKREMPPTPFKSNVSCRLFILVYSLTLESWLHNTSEKHSVFHQPKLCLIPPCVSLSFRLFRFVLVQFGRETLSNDVYSTVSPRHHVTIGTVSKQTQGSFVRCAGCG